MDVLVLRLVKRQMWAMLRTLKNMKNILKHIRCLHKHQLINVFTISELCCLFFFIWNTLERLVPVLSQPRKPKLELFKSLRLKTVVERHHVCV